jgi:CRISPR-associated helicase Cas3/CRISPR-associated endonuclease Cas3-HD
VWGGGDEAYAAGLLHDLGKYTELFQQRLRGEVQGVDHWTVGAAAASNRYRGDSWALALAIQGHHIGLQCGTGSALQTSLNLKQLAAAGRPGLRLTSSEPDVLLDLLAADGLELPKSVQSIVQTNDEPMDWMLAVRFLFSALVDADHTETAAHFDGESEGYRKYRTEPPVLQPAQALERIEAHVRSLRSRYEADPDANEELQRLRTELFEACREGGEERPGLFTLTAPTGSGKTLAMLAFAMRHAAAHGLRRVVVALPFLSILDQTVKTCRDLFEAPYGPDFVLEHHSLADSRYDGSTPDSQSMQGSRRRAMVETWDAPLVVTTHVQLLESLFANKPMRCRKLHNLAHSVILLDEVQTLPVSLTVPTLAALSALANRFGSTVVFATATQPAFEVLDAKVRDLAPLGWQPRELVPQHLDLARRLDRVDIRFELEQTVSWAAVAHRVAKEPQVLVVVNLKKHAQALAELLAKEAGDEGLFLLSTSLCPAHRRENLAAIEARLRNGEVCRLVATQCIEAGVDLDFPVGFRALGPLDSIVQVAGRVNRHGLRASGHLVVFLPEDETYPGGLYRNAAKLTGSRLRQSGRTGLDLSDDDFFREYFEHLYALTSEVDLWKSRKPDEKNLNQALIGRDFCRVAKSYRLIEQDAVEVLVPYDEGAFASLRSEVEGMGYPTREWIRKARPHAVSVYRSNLKKPEIGHALEPILIRGRDGSRESGWYYCLEARSYDRRWGFMGIDDPWLIG